MKKLRNIFFKERKKEKGERRESENSNQTRFLLVEEYLFQKKKKEGDG